MGRATKRSMRSRGKFPLFVVLLIAMSFLFGGATAVVMYATGEEVANLPKMQMVSHTEYAYNAPGQIIARIVDFQGNPVAVTSCNATILYPDKTIFVNAAGMTPSVNISGDFYYTFTTPNGPEGTYEYQATCYYGVNKNASVTNSFHLTPNFNYILSNLSVVQTDLAAIQGNLTDLSNQLNANVSTILAELSNVNSDLYQAIVSVNDSVAALDASVGANFTQLDANLQNNFTQLQTNVTQILDAISNITVDVNLTEVLDAIASVNATANSIQSTMAGNFTQVFAEFDDIQTNFSVVIDYLDFINQTVSAIDYSAALAEINSTTQNTYAYVTGTLATNINDVLTQLGVINATVNRIETTTGQINSTVNDILQNQQDRVYMDVFSG